MGNFLVIPPKLCAKCLQQSTATALGSALICYQADIRTVTKLWQPFSLNKPHYLTQASPLRLNEFFAGRILAEAVLRQHFDCLAPITDMDAKLPQWPQGLIGSISHSKHLVMVAISSHAAYLGIDVEHIVEKNMALECASLILTPYERSLWQTNIAQALSFPEYLTLVFSLKESLYKAVYPIAQTYIDFLDAQIVSLDIRQRTVLLKFSSEIMHRYALCSEYQGFWQLQLNHVMTWVTAKPA